VGNEVAKNPSSLGNNLDSDASHKQLANEYESKSGTIDGYTLVTERRRDRHRDRCAGERASAETRCWKAGKRVPRLP
jgi:hypothetical protein